MKLLNLTSILDNNFEETVDTNRAFKKQDIVLVDAPSYIVKAFDKLFIGINTPTRYNSLHHNTRSPSIEPIIAAIEGVLLEYGDIEGILITNVFPSSVFSSTSGIYPDYEYDTYVNNTNKLILELIKMISIQKTSINLYTIAPHIIYKYVDSGNGDITTIRENKLYLECVYGDALTREMIVSTIAGKNSNHSSTLTKVRYGVNDDPHIDLLTNLQHKLDNVISNPNSQESIEINDIHFCITFNRETSEYTFECWLEDYDVGDDNSIKLNILSTMSPHDIFQELKMIGVEK